MEARRVLPRVLHQAELPAVRGPPGGDGGIIQRGPSGSSELGVPGSWFLVSSYWPVRARNSDPGTRNSAPGTRNVRRRPGVALCSVVEQPRHHLRAVRPGSDVQRRLAADTAGPDQGEIAFQDLDGLRALVLPDG